MSNVNHNYSEHCYGIVAYSGASCVHWLDYTAYISVHPQSEVEL